MLQIRATVAILLAVSGCGTDPSSEPLGLVTDEADPSPGSGGAPSDLDAVSADPASSGPASSGSASNDDAPATSGNCEAMDVDLEPIALCSPAPTRYFFNGAVCEAWTCDACRGSECEQLFDELAQCQAAYGQCTPPYLYSHCASDADCAGKRCIAGTCGGPCTQLEQCPAFEQCVAPHPSQCSLAPVTGSGPPSEASEGACLPKCRSDADCKAFGENLVCWERACVWDLPACLTDCEPIAAHCVAGCAVISATPYYPEKRCKGPEPEVLGCHPPVPTTGDARCVQNAEGVVYAGLSGTYTSALRLNGPYTDCDSELELEALTNTSVCP